MKFNTLYDHESVKGLECTEPTLTEQSHKDSCDINYILKRFETTGELPDMIRQNPIYGDFSDVGSYQEAMHIVQQAQLQFASLSSKIRERFQNDASQFLAFCENPANVEEMVELGLAIKKEEEPVKMPIKQKIQGKKENSSAAKADEE